MKEDIIQKIAATKRREVAALKQVFGITDLICSSEAGNREILSLRDSILSHPVAIIAEHKRRSPSLGEIAPMSDVGKVATAYAANGAAAMSVLTDTPFFGGSLVDLSMARVAAPSLPILRKEFIVDEYQIHYAKLLGADAVLLIASMLSEEDLKDFNDIAHFIGLQTLVEVHSAEEAAIVPKDADMVGINNRNLSTVATDISHSARLIDSLPADAVKIAESGIHTPDDILQLKGLGFDGFLIGEAFMSTTSPGDTLKEFISVCES